MASRNKKRRLVVYAAPASGVSPPAAPVKPAAAAKPAEGLLDFIIKLAAVGVFVVGIATLASPWIRSSDRQHPLPPAGWTCWQVTRSTSTGSRESRRCEPSLGWHVEEWPGVGRVAAQHSQRNLRFWSPLRASDTLQGFAGDLTVGLAQYVGDGAERGNRHSESLQ
jgi:hypothetical protein